MADGMAMWRTLVGSMCGLAGFAVIASSVVAPASADGTQARVQVAEYVRVADAGDASAPDVDSNVAVSVVVRAGGYDVTPR